MQWELLGMEKILKRLIIQRAQAVACSGFSSDSLSGLGFNMRSDITQAAEKLPPPLFDRRACVFVCQSWPMPSILSQVLRRLDEVCTVMRSLSSVIQSELLSGSLPREIRREKGLVNI